MHPPRSINRNPKLPATALIVECELIVCSLLQKVLEREGYETLAAGAAEQALKMDSSSPIDLLVTEINLPGASGIQLADRLARLQPELRILFISGYLENAISERNGLGRHRAFLPKPFEGSTLVQSVKQLMTRSPMPN